MDRAERIAMTVSCRDCDPIPKVAGAGTIVTDGDRRLQVMHNGLRVVAGGYHGDWVTEVIAGLEGHHEPQEELLFHQLLEHVEPGSLIAELGSHWAFYTLWYLLAVPGSRAVCVEPDPNNMAIGRANAELNGMADRIVFEEAWVGGPYAPMHVATVESTRRPRTLARLDMDAVLALASGDPVELLHMDVQGAELAFIGSMAGAVERGSVRFAVVSTHHSSLSGSPTMHEDCRAALTSLGAAILAEHTIQESFSGDGLIVASFFPQDASIELGPISRNRAEAALFPVP